MADLLDQIDAAVEGCCAGPGCGERLTAASPSAYFHSQECQTAYHERQTDRPDEVRGSRTVAPDVMRWRPDLVAEFDDADLTLMDQHHRDDTGLDYCVYTRTGSDVAFLRVDDGHRFVGMDVPWSELEASGPSEPFRRLERELSDRRRLDPEPDRLPTVPLLAVPGRGGVMLRLLRDAWMTADNLGPAQQQWLPPSLRPILLIRYPDEDRIIAYYDFGDTEEQLRAWLRANQLEPEQVRVGSTAVIRDGQLMVEGIERTTDGRIVFDGNEPRTCQHSVPLLQDPPQAFVAASPEVPPAVLNAAAAFAAGSQQGRVLWMAEPPCDLDQLTVADLNRAVELPAGGPVRAGRAVAWMGDPAPEAEQVLLADLYAALRMLEDTNPAVRFAAGTAVIQRLRDQAPRNRAPHLPLGGLMGIPIVADPALHPQSSRLEYADGQRLESHACQWRWEVRDEAGGYRCTLRWSDGSVCDSTAASWAMVRRRERLVRPVEVDHEGGGEW